MTTDSALQERTAMADQWAHEAGLAYRDGDTERAAQLVRSSPRWRIDMGADQVKQPQLMTT